MAKIEQKQIIVNEIKEKFDKATSVIIVDARGVTVSQDTDLRKKLRDAGIDYKVYKNSMINFAVKGTKYEDLSKYFKGPSAIAFSYDDATVAARIISKESKNVPKLEFKAGFLDDTTYDAEGIKAIANIPSREELLSKLFGSFKSPMSSFVRVINSIAKEKEE